MLMKSQTKFYNSQNISDASQQQQVKWMSICVKTLKNDQNKIPKYKMAQYC